MTFASALAVAVVQVAAPQAFDIPPGPAPAAINRLAAQAGVDVTITIDLTGRRTPPVRGPMTTPEAFERMLAPLGARAVRLSDRLYRIEAAPRRSVGVRPASAARLPPPAVPVQLEEVVVTAAARRGGLDGANGRSALDAGAVGRVRGLSGSDALATLSASVDSTRQGAGHNKLFIRGVADSAFTGPLQATVGQYYGDLRLNYGSPDPDLLMIDVDRIEVFEGPQGSRFGAGSIGGVVRIQPRFPELGVDALDLSSGLTFTADGAVGSDATLVFNRAAGPQAAVRGAAYVRREGGYLDNPVRGSRDVDTVDIAGGRLAARLFQGDWTVDGVALAQRISAADAQTVAAGSPDLIKTRTVAEPYESAFILAGLSAHRRLSRGRLTVAAGLSDQTLDERLDATLAGAPPSVVDRRQRVTAVSFEARLDWDAGSAWSWNGGAAMAAGRTRTLRRRGPPDGAPAPIGSVLNGRFLEAAGFLEAVVRPAPTVAVAVGGRISLGSAAFRFEDAEVEPRLIAAGPPGADVAFSPTAAIRWTLGDALTAFARLERGVRPGGISEARGVVAALDGDRVTLFETGVELVGSSGDWSLAASAGWFDWRDIQSDFVTQGGDLVTANIGDGEVRFLQARAAWTPAPALSLSAGAFVNESRLRMDGFNTIGVDQGPIPNVAASGLQVSVSHLSPMVGGRPLLLAADLRFVGASRPGVGPGLDVVQGGYWLTDLSARWGDDQGAVVLRLSNPLDARAIRYGVGSPYQLSDPQGAPLRPLSLRIGFETAF